MLLAGALGTRTRSRGLSGARRFAVALAAVASVQQEPQVPGLRAATSSAQLRSAPPLHALLCGFVFDSEASQRTDVCLSGSRFRGPLWVS